MTDYHKKYLKYKKKYIDAKKLSLNNNLVGGAKRGSSGGTKRWSSGLPIEIIKNSDLLKEIEDEMIKDLNILFDKYDLEKYLYTKKIIVNPDVRVIPNSHNCVITITRRYILDKKDTLEHLLSIFIHEQFHCWEEKNKTKIETLMPILYDKFPDIRFESPYGSRTKESTYNHIIICFHEYNSLIDLLGPEKAKQIIGNTRMYKDIYQTILSNFDEIKELLKEHELLP